MQLQNLFLNPDKVQRPLNVSEHQVVFDMAETIPYDMHGTLVDMVADLEIDVVAEVDVEEVADDDENLR
jgi:hypothetical protein